MTIPTHVMHTGDVARVLGVSTTTVYRLDANLKPIRTASGRRLYDPAVVQRFAGLLAERTSRSLSQIAE